MIQSFLRARSEIRPLRRLQSVTLQNPVGRLGEHHHLDCFVSTRSGNRGRFTINSARAPCSLLSPPIRLYSSSTSSSSETPTLPSHDSSLTPSTHLPRTHFPTYLRYVFTYHAPYGDPHYSHSTTLLFSSYLPSNPSHPSTPLNR